MTLKELINSVDSEEYNDSPLFQKLRNTKPEYGSNCARDLRFAPFAN